MQVSPLCVQMHKSGQRNSTICFPHIYWTSQILRLLFFGGKKALKILLFCLWRRPQPLTAFSFLPRFHLSVKVYSPGLISIASALGFFCSLLLPESRRLCEVFMKATITSAIKPPVACPWLIEDIEVPPLWTERTWTRRVYTQRVGRGLYPSKRNKKKYKGCLFFVDLRM